MRWEAGCSADKHLPNETFVFLFDLIKFSLEMCTGFYQIDGETMETVTEFILEASKITADGDSNHEIKRCLPLGRKAMTNLDSVLKKQTHYFANKGPSSQGYGFSSGYVWM